ncbi:hypothetical protein N7495_007990 [Penicillium taxi]|uniref:uncharacterized protein n=1 Tax=Penicillium taxi TaxID=168475 RepID=UPI0025457E3D|nr:uncharacterized protein N7495_007990 [Penicillium taxi]KAJ5887949.1 hypothetical protein N7495_007990 [Penicillium taxi]
MQQFPEFGFLHKPTFLEYDYNDELSSLKLCAVMALCARYMPETVSLYGSPLAASNHFAGYVRKEVMEHVAVHADIEIIQTLVLLGLHDWGCCNGFSAWIYIGMAIRTGQMLQARLEEIGKSQKEQPNTVLRETIHRTIWACFVIDCMLGCGKHRVRTFEAEKVKIPLPINDEDYVFGNDSSPNPTYLTKLVFEGYAQSLQSPSQKLGVEYCLSLTIQGFDIWSKLSQWICTGGRGGDLPSSHDPPWKETTFWYRTMTSLENWRASLSPRLLYSSGGHNLLAHIARNQGESFATINLLYYLMVIFLNREYIPFFPHRIKSPCGPTDPPLLKEQAPPGWWDRGSIELFGAASSIIKLLQSLQQHGIQLQTPFTSFCVFSAATTLSYANAWPHMAPGFQNAGELYTWGLKWLIESSELWKIAEGWCDTLTSVSQLYIRIKKDTSRFCDVGREPFIDLEDSIQRFAETESGRIPAANILVSLSRKAPQATKDKEKTSASRVSHETRLCDVSPGTIETQEVEESRDESLRSNEGTPFAQSTHSEYISEEFADSQDIIASMMGEGAGLNWFHDLSW